MNIETRIALMATGNKSLHTEAHKDVSITKEPLDTRPSPKKLHHWTERELINLLDEHSYPACTYRDRLQYRHETVARALANGEYVPLDVIEEFPQVLEDAEMLVLSEGFAEYRLGQEREARGLMEEAIGYTSPSSIYHFNLQALLQFNLTEMTTSSGGAFLSIPKLSTPLSMDGWKYRLSSIAGRPQRTGRFGLIDLGREPKLRIHVDIPGYPWVCHDVSMTLIVAILYDMISAGKVSKEQVGALLPKFTDSQNAIVSVCRDGVNSPSILALFQGGNTQLSIRACS